MMNLAKQQTQIKTMSSKQIADVVGSRHDHVKRSIERLAEKGVIQLPPLEEVKNHLGQTVQEYQVNERDSYVVVAQLCPEYTAKLVDWWMATKNLVSTQTPQTLPQALRLAADLAEQKAILESKVQQDAPKVQFYDHVTEAVNCQSIEQVAKVLGTGRNRLFAWLRQQKILLPNNEPYQTYIDRGFFRVIEGEYNDKKHGDSHTYTRTLITGKGFTFIQKRFVGAPA